MKTLHKQSFFLQKFPKSLHFSSAAREMKSFIALSMVLLAVSATPPGAELASDRFFFGKKLIDEASGPCVLKDNLSNAMKVLNLGDNSVRGGHIIIPYFDLQCF